MLATHGRARTLIRKRTGGKNAALMDAALRENLCNGKGEAAGSKKLSVPALQRRARSTETDGLDHAK